ncbi:hypothetical protein [Methanoregula sp.]|uniref:hypothetical protein n=1 Tax=Methanoregula sp. TaxID=2052170 RepID=UPI00262F3687|nr:hypothetical protein [Methanoregula sp.]MDD5142802.1 hypothetical protein [Methanoregula sp.]
MSEDGVAPVVAVMLILAVVVTFFAAWNAYYVPSMKAQSEIAHIKDVESGFLRFSSDIETAVSLKRNVKLSEPLPLGGGDFLFDPVRSGGEIKVYNASPDGYLRLNWTGEKSLENPDHFLNLVAFSYKPVNNFWQNQGYGWKNGIVYVFNSERNLTTPLKDAKPDDITYDLAGILVEIEPVELYSDPPGNCSALIVRTVNITPDTKYNRVSGNGNAMLALNSSSPPTIPRVTVPQATSLNLTIMNPPSRFSSSLWGSVNDSVENMRATCANVERPLIDPAKREIRLTFKPAPYPSLTLISETTEITVKAY